jgi:AcrR family transcriptional regulator
MPKSSVAKSSRPRPVSGAPSTRDRLIEAVIEIVRTDGLAELTTVEITRRAGIAQPGFYKYFRNVDECLEEATTRALDERRKTFVAMRRGIKNRNDPGEVAAHCRAILDAVAVDRPFNELMLRYRRDPSTLGKAIRAFEKRTLEDFAEELWAQAHAAGLRSEQRPALALLAELALHGLGAYIERVLEDPNADRTELAKDLAEFTIGGTRAVLGQRLGKQRSRAKPAS